MLSTSQEVKVSIEREMDIVSARKEGKALALGLGFSSSDATLVATVISELGRNIVLYAKRGEIVLSVVKHEGQSGVIVTARDQGMGIADVLAAMQDGYSSAGRTGIGLPGIRRLMDEFDILSEVGKGTVVTTTKWQRGRSARTAIRSQQFSRPWDTWSPSLDGRGSDEHEPGSVESAFARSQEARNLSPQPPRRPGSLDAMNTSP